MIRFFKNYFSTLLFIGIGYIFYTTNSYYIQFFSGANSIYLPFSSFSITTTEIFQWIFGIYTVMLIPYYLLEKSQSKACILFSWIFSHPRQPIDQEKKGAMLSLLVKFFFVPLMLHWIFGHIASMINMSYMIWQNWGTLSFIDLFNSSLYSFLFQIILFSDVLFFTIGYLIESKRLENEIISVEPTLLGWIVCLACYPPFNETITKIVGWKSSDYPNLLAIHVAFHIMVGISILLLMGIYAFASINLNLKASNLTNRGIVSSGVYGIVRHPAYIAKNLAWWIGGIPFMIIALHTSFLAVISVILSLCFWSFIYFLRAITEERHLLLGNNGYAEYMKKVRYRFIPGIF